MLLADVGPPPGRAYCTTSALTYTGYYYFGDDLMMEYTGPNEDDLKAYYVYANGQRVAKVGIDTNDVRFYLTDHLGSTVATIGWNGNLRNKYFYLPFGRLHRFGVSDFNQLMYTGQMYEHEIAPELYYYGARYYDPELRMFLQVDPRRSDYPSWSPYTYALDNPMKLADPLGSAAMAPLSNGSEEDEDNERQTESSPIAADRFRTDYGSIFNQAVLRLLDAAGRLAKDAGEALIAGLLENETTTATMPDGTKVSVPVFEPGIGGIRSVGKGVARGVYTVYQGVDKAGRARYVGATRRSPQVRFAEHLRAKGTGRDVLRYGVLRGALSQTQARFLEQKLINRYGLQNSGQLLNRINAIDPRKWTYYGF